MIKTYVTDRLALIAKYRAYIKKHPDSRFNGDRYQKIRELIAEINAVMAPKKDLQTK